ncbi:VOC family protein [Nonomuraea recticatena]|uniref:VOC family protein n=1 Tax=Nonomuraea recticatena TaxID=46178 RepID=UPI00360C743E
MAVNLGYYTISVRDLDRAATFYAGLFGWELSREHDTYLHAGNTAVPMGLTRESPRRYPTSTTRSTTSRRRWSWWASSAGARARSWRAGRAGSRSSTTTRKPPSASGNPPPSQTPQPLLPRVVPV